ncbi:MAG: hypothetical protein JXB14_04115 [Candidatus Altiarchaeota archaeon]|nr:hypothetical protein [Candidatus Altiarchaeota archaeon]
MRSPRRFLEIVIVLSLLVLAQIPFALGSWASEVNAPYASGTHTILIRATHNNITATYPLSVTVREYVLASLGLSVKPYPQFEFYPPIPLRYNISLNSRSVDTLLNSTVAVFFRYEGVTLGSVAPQLQGRNGVFSTSADVPFRGEYLARIYVEVLDGEKVYSGTFTSVFTSDEASPDLEIIPYLEHRVFTPAEAFEAKARMRFKEQDIEGSNLLKVTLVDVDNTLGWDKSQRIYNTGLTAPRDEGIYKAYFYAVGQEFVQPEHVYVLDLTKEQAQACPITEQRSCNYPTEARKCFALYRSGQSYISEEQLIDCITSAGYPEAIEFFCNSSAVGDLDNDGQLDSDDAYIISEYILAIPEEEERQRYLSCADFNHDSVIDQLDVDCMTRVISGKWFGGIGGGICLDFDTSSPLKGDMDGDTRITDEDMHILDEMIRVSTNVEIPYEILAHTDFNQDERLTEKDLKCLENFNGLELGSREGFTISEQIPNECMEIYELDNCKNIPGDLNGDTKISELDEILIMMANRELISSDLVYMDCADVNKDDSLTTEDEICIKEYVSGNKDKYYACIDCPDSLPQEFFSLMEICNDGWDNDCDGLVDRTSEDPAEDWCGCNENTPCEMQFNPTGGTTSGTSMTGSTPSGMQITSGLGNLGSSGSVTSGYYVCRDVSWDSSGYEWMLPVPCMSQVECETTTCAGRTTKCAHDGTKFDWRMPMAMPKETDDPDDDPRTCNDGHDNDCKKGDEPCEEEEDWMMYAMLAMAAIPIIIQIAPVIAQGLGSLFPAAAAAPAASASAVATPVVSAAPAGALVPTEALGGAAGGIKFVPDPTGWVPDPHPTWGHAPIPR